MFDLKINNSLIGDKDEDRNCREVECWAVMNELDHQSSFSKLLPFFHVNWFSVPQQLSDNIEDFKLFTHKIEHGQTVKNYFTKGRKKQEPEL